MVSKQDISSSVAKWFVRTVSIMEEDGKLMFRRKLAGVRTFLGLEVPSSFSSTSVTHDCVQNCSQVPRLESEFHFSEPAPLCSSPVGMYSHLRYRWKQQSRQPHPQRKQGWSVRNRKDTGAENTNTLGTNLKPGQVSGCSLYALCLTDFGLHSQPFSIGRIFLNSDSEHHSFLWGGGAGTFAVQLILSNLLSHIFPLSVSLTLQYLFNGKMISECQRAGHLMTQ